MRRMLWLYSLLALTLLTPKAGLAFQLSSGTRIGLQHVDGGLAMARGNRDFNGKERRTADIYTIHAQLQLSLLDMTLALWDYFSTDHRLRVGDYIRTEFITGWMLQGQSEVEPGAEVDLKGGDGIIAGVFAIGAQANYLISNELEVGGAIAKATWNTTLGFGNEYQKALKPTDEPYPLLWVGRARYGNLIGEYHRSSTPRYLNNIDGTQPGQAFDYRHSYSSLKLRYYPDHGNGNLGIELDRYGYHIYREAPPVIAGHDTSRSVTNIRISLGYSL